MCYTSEAVFPTKQFWQRAGVSVYLSEMSRLVFGDGGVKGEVSFFFRPHESDIYVYTLSLSGATIMHSAVQNAEYVTEPFRGRQKFISLRCSKKSISHCPPCVGLLAFSRPVLYRVKTMTLTVGVDNKI